MLRVPVLKIPDVLPHPDAIRSFGDNRHSYDPEFWEFQYENFRYLGRVLESKLVKRYREIIRNMSALVSPERHIIPIRSFLSSWYWYRKEHQTRLEFLIRGIETPIEPPNEILNNTPVAAPAHPRSPNAGDILFRYGERKYMQPIVEQGSVRITPASYYRIIEDDCGRADDELSKRSFWPGEYSKITTMDGKEIPIKGDVQRTVSAPDFYILCMTCDWNPALFDDFKADLCVVIHDPEIFATKIEIAARIQLSDWYFHHCPVHYFDPFERSRHEVFDAGMCKNFCFAYQREYRFLWIHTGGKEAAGFKFLELGPLGDIAELYGRP